RDRRQQRREPRAGRLLVEIGCKFLAELGRIGERKGLRERLDEEIERIDDREIGQEIDVDREFRGLLRKDVTGEPVSVRVLLPIYEMLVRRHLEPIAQDLGWGMRRRPQPDNLRPETDRPVVLVASDVVEVDENRHRTAVTPRNKRHSTMQISGRTGAQKPDGCAGRAGIIYGSQWRADE